MTLVAAWKEEGTPFLLGDFLVSRKRAQCEPEQHACLPTQDDVSVLLTPPSDFVITDLVQKVYVISDRVAVGWAGSRIGAATVIRRLRSTLRELKKPFRPLRKALAPFTADEIGNLELVGWVLEGTRARCFEWSSAKSSVLAEVESAVAGSGAESFSHVLNPTHRWRGEQPTVNRVLVMVGKLLGHEVLHRTNLWDRFGGGIELIHHRDGRFQVVPSVTFAFVRTTEVDGMVDEKRERRVLKIDYQDGAASILCCVSNDDRTHRELLFPVSPVDEDTGPAQYPSHLSLRSSYYCVVADITDRRGRTIVYPMTVGDECRATLIDYRHYSDGNESFEIADNCFDLVLDCLNRVRDDRTQFPPLLYREGKPLLPRVREIQSGRSGISSRLHETQSAVGRGGR
ncbi:MAG TPA: hypothetical protein VFJ58_19635 [Armatimonadota bacterium]|nr:hypothetical protein [Armatimonadota bacterium]